MHEKKKNRIRENRAAYLAEMERETLRRRINYLLDKPMNKRTNFLRKKLPNGGSCL